MPQVYRVSMVVMIFADKNNPGKHNNTPEPFLEIRAFLFLDRSPTPFEENRIKAALRISINEIMEKFLPHIFMSEYGKFSLLTRQTAKAVNLNTKAHLTRIAKVEIEGFEVEPMDIDEIFHETIYWKELNGRLEHNLFNENNTTNILHGKKRLQLATNYVYRYVAFYTESGDIKRDYDEFDIEAVVRNRIRLENLQKRLYGKMYNMVSRLHKDINELEGTLLELEKVSKKLQRNQ